jgi:biopolymer transport protein ExbD
MEMTPLIDVVFLLLTFFVLAVVMMVRAEVLDVRLPVLGAANPAAAGSAITVAIDAEGAITVNGEPTAPGSMVERLIALRAEDPAARLLIAADEGGRSGALLAVLDELARAGLTDFGIVGRAGEAPPDAPGPP